MIEDSGTGREGCARTMKALFLALSPQGFGETLIGLALADQLVPAGVTSHFIVEETARTILAERRTPGTDQRDAGPLPAE